MSDYTKNNNAILRANAAANRPRNNSPIRATNGYVGSPKVKAYDKRYSDEHYYAIAKTFNEKELKFTLKMSGLMPNQQMNETLKTKPDSQHPQQQQYQQQSMHYSALNANQNKNIDYSPNMIDRGYNTLNKNPMINPNQRDITNHYHNQYGYPDNQQNQLKNLPYRQQDNTLDNYQYGAQPQSFGYMAQQYTQDNQQQYQYNEMNRAPPGYQQNQPNQGVDQYQMPSEKYYSEPFLNHQSMNQLGPNGMDHDNGVRSQHNVSLDYQNQDKNSQINPSPYPDTLQLFQEKFEASKWDKLRNSMEKKYDLLDKDSSKLMPASPSYMMKNYNHGYSLNNPSNKLRQSIPDTKDIFAPNQGMPLPQIQQQQQQPGFSAQYHRQNNSNPNLAKEQLMENFDNHPSPLKNPSANTNNNNANEEKINVYTFNLISGQPQAIQIKKPYKPIENLNYAHN